MPRSFFGEQQQASARPPASPAAAAPVAITGAFSLLTSDADPEGFCARARDFDCEVERPLVVARFRPLVEARFLVLVVERFGALLVCWAI